MIEGNKKADFSVGLPIGTTIRVILIRIELSFKWYWAN